MSKYNASIENHLFRLDLSHNSLKTVPSQLATISKLKVKSLLDSILFEQCFEGTKFGSQSTE